MRKLLLILLVLPFVVGCKHNKTTSPTTTTEKPFDSGDYFTCLYWAEAKHSDEMTRLSDDKNKYYERLIDLLINDGYRLSIDAQVILIKSIKSRLKNFKDVGNKSVDSWAFARKICRKQGGLDE